jgi:hypothetical protein
MEDPQLAAIYNKETNTTDELKNMISILDE